MRGASLAGGLRRLISAAPVLCIFASIVLINALAETFGGGIVSYSASANIVERSEEAQIAEKSPVMRAAEELKAEFGIGISFGEEARIVSEAYENEPLSDPERLLPAIAQIRSVLGMYPAGFFEALTEDCSEGLGIKLCGRIRGVSANTVGSPAAISMTENGRRVVVLDVSDKNSALGPVLVHELCHIVDRRLDALAKDDPSHWSAEGWAALNPEGFEYYYAYTDPEGRPYSETDDREYTPEGEGGIWFADSYSKTYPTEDRARLMELLFSRSPGASLFRSPHISAKLAYYFAAIRYCLDPDGEWTEPTFWEELLKKAEDTLLRTA